jgi:glucosamine kinase
MAEPIFIGIDGGGTHCRARIRDASGRLVGEGAGGSANIRLDLDLVWSSILTACRQAVRRGGLEVRELARAHVGLGLAGSAQPSAVARMLAYQHPFRAVAVETDAHIAWLGAFGGGEGAILIVGTGSCGYGCLQGRRFTIGGRGFQISDEGSGAAIGREVLRRTIWAYDGRAAPSALASAVLDRFGGAPEAMVDWANQARPSAYASFAPLIFDHARRGDPLGIELVTGAAAAITQIARRLMELGAGRLCLFGGMAEPLKPWLSPDVLAAVVEPAADPLEGAIMLARSAKPPP